MEAGLVSGGIAHGTGSAFGPEEECFRGGGFCGERGSGEGGDGGEGKGEAHGDGIGDGTENFLGDQMVNSISESERSLPLIWPQASSQRGMTAAVFME